MPTQTVSFGAAQGQTITVNLYTPDTISLVASAAATAVAGAGGEYTVVFSDLSSGMYLLCAYNSGGTRLARGYVRVLAATATYIAYTTPDAGEWTFARAAVLDRVNTGLVQDGAVWQFTANMLENGPAGGGGGGSATVENQAAILQHLLEIKGTGWTSADSLAVISDLMAAGIGSALASLGFTTGTITGFPSTLRVRDSYTQEVNRSISVFVRDAQGVPVTQIGSKTFADASFSPTCVISQDGQSGRVEANVTWVPPVGAVEGYLRIEIPASKSAYARAGAATVQVILRWPGVTFTLASQSVTWLPSL